MTRSTRLRLTGALAPLCLALAGPAAAQMSDRGGDPREGLDAGLFDAQSAIWNLEMTQSVPTPDGFFDPDAIWRAPQPGADGSPPQRSPIIFANTDAAFQGSKVLMGSWHGFNVFDRVGGGPLEPVLSVVCPGGQGDVSVVGNLVFMSTEENRARLDCSGAGTQGPVSAERFRGVRIFDLSDMSNPRQVAAVQTCRGSHTHTVVPHKTDPGIVYIYNSGTSFVRAGAELEGCSAAGPDADPNTALFSIDIIKVPLDAPEEAAIIGRPRIFADRETGEIDGLWGGGPLAEGAQNSRATNHCHDVTVYPDKDLAAGACSGNGILLDISDRENPRRIDEIGDPQMAYWHSATFNNDATKVVFADEWGGGLAPRCTEGDPKNWGADLIVDITDDGFEAASTFKIPAIQTRTENCVSHNGAIVPVPGRDIMVQGFYQGGLTVFDFTDSANPYEIAYFDRGPIEADALVLGGYWSAYWHNGRIYAPEIVRGLDVFRLAPSEHLTANEIAAAEMVAAYETNPQTQREIMWPDHPVVAHAYLDQLARTDAIDAALMATARQELDRWGRGNPRIDRLSGLESAFRTAATTADGRDAERLTSLAQFFGRLDAAN